MSHSEATPITKEVKEGFDVVINPDIEEFHYGTLPTILKHQGAQTVGTVTRTDGNRISVQFHVFEPIWSFRRSELLNAPRPSKDVSPKESGGMKYDNDKPRMDLLFSGCPNALEQVGSVLTFGAKKYAAHSWQTVPNGDERYLAALIRHITAIGKGEEVDPESGMSHLAHVACNALFILELECKKKTGASK